MINYSNPRKTLVVEDWPWSKYKTRATFQVEYKRGHGDRCSRVVVNPKTGVEAAPKYTTYGRIVRIVDGDNGRTYIATMTMYSHISILQANMQYQEEAIFSHDSRYAPLLAAMKESS